MTDTPEAAREARFGFHPFDEQMWSLWAGECMARHCRRPAESRITLQIHWRQDPTCWAFCNGHTTPWIHQMLELKPYYLEIQPWGFYQEEIPMLWIE